MSGGRAAIFAGKSRKSTSSSIAKKILKEDRAGFKKAFGDMKGYNKGVKKNVK